MGMIVFIAFKFPRRKRLLQMGGGGGQFDIHNFETEIEITIDIKKTIFPSLTACLSNF